LFLEKCKKIAEGWLANDKDGLPTPQRLFCIKARQWIRLARLKGRARNHITENNSLLPDVGMIV
jgi:hypothetical protein